MTAIGPILAATDFSTQARHAADRAARLAHETHSALTVMHVLPGEPLARLRAWLGPSSEPEAVVRDEAHRRLHALAAELAHSRRVTVDTEEATGSALEEILRSADRPLLVVRQTPHEPYRRALVAVDFSPWSRDAVMLARRVAPHARLLILTAFQLPFQDKLNVAGVDPATVEGYRQRARAEAQERLFALADEVGLSASQWEPCVVEGEASLRIVENEQAHDCDLVVLGKHGQSAATDWLLGSVTSHAVAECVADVLVSTRRVA
jgi:nucleotide-binding universal stress UspA family protein